MKRFTINNALNSLKDHNQPFKELFSHGSLTVEIYKPEKVDLQTPHTRDEVYVIASGSGTFIKGDSEQKFESGEVLFVPAGVEHRFVDFSDDFSTWVLFYGPEGGEKESIMNYLLTNQQSQRLQFRKLNDTDFDHWLEFFKNKQALKGVALDPNTSPEELCKNWFEKINLRYQQKRGGMNVMINKHTGELVGMCGLLVQTVEGVDRLEIGYSVLPKFWGQGFASEAAQKCRDFAFENDLADSLISIVLPDNTGSINVALKNGMRLEKVVDDYQGLQVNIYRIDKNDWLKLNV